MKTQKKIYLTIRADEIDKDDWVVPIRKYDYHLPKTADFLDETNYDQEIYYSLTDRGDFD